MAAAQAALRGPGVICTQGECQWLHLDLIKRVLTDARSLFGTAEYAYASVPSYPSGQLGFVVATVDDAVDVTRCNRVVPEDMQRVLRYYSPSMHTAAFTLPEFARRLLLKD